MWLRASASCVWVISTVMITPIPIIITRGMNPLRRFRVTIHDLWPRWKTSSWSAVPIIPPIRRLSIGKIWRCRTNKVYVRIWRHLKHRDWSWQWLWRRRRRRSKATLWSPTPTAVACSSAITSSIRPSTNLLCAVRCCSRASVAAATLSLR